jgi:hypothetical protein
MPPFTFLILVSDYLMLSSAEIYLAQCGDILPTNGCISSSEAEKEEGRGSVSEKATPHVVPRVFTKRLDSERAQIPLKRDLQSHFLDQSNN